MEQTNEENPHMPKPKEHGRIMHATSSELPSWKASRKEDVERGMHGSIRKIL
jgi:hypothetical protein